MEVNKDFIVGLQERPSPKADPREDQLVLSKPQQSSTETLNMASVHWIAPCSYMHNDFHPWMIMQHHCLDRICFPSVVTEQWMGINMCQPDCGLRLLLLVATEDQCGEFIPWGVLCSCWCHAGTGLLLLFVSLRLTLRTQAMRWAPPLQIMHIHTCKYSLALDCICRNLTCGTP